MSEHQYKFNVVMTCGGCSGAVTRVLEKAKNNGEGISSYEVKQEAHEVLVTGTIPYDDLLAKIKKTGKEASSLRCRPSTHTYHILQVKSGETLV